MLPLWPPELPVALYEDDEADNELCRDCRNCCRISAMLAVLPDELLVLSLEEEDELLSDDGGEPPGPPLAKALLNTSFNSAA